MRKLITLSLFSIACLTSYGAEDIKTVPSNLKEATVFFQGAELTHTASALLGKGENELIIENLSANIDKNSLKISATGGVIISSSEFSIDYLANKGVSASTKKLQDSIKIYQKQLRQVQVNQATNKELITLLQANKNIAGTQNGLSVAELMKMMDYYKLKSSELQNAQSDNDEKIALINTSIARVQSQLQQEAVKNNKTSGILKLQLIASMAVTSNFTISYYTAQSGWTPYYDINIQSTDKPIKIASKAKIKQSTGLDWNKVKLNLSTSTPSNGKIAPLFSAWFLQYQQLLSSNRMAKSSLQGAVMQNSYSYDEVEVLESMAIREETQKPSIPSNTPLYIVDGMTVSANEFNQIDPNMIAQTQHLESSSATAIYGNQASAGAVIVTLKSMDDFVVAEDNDLHMTYNIDIPYTIPGNGKEQIIDLQTNEITADFKYYSAPKLDTETYLLAEISNWQNLNLLGGKANVTYAGTYVGETYINPNSTQSTLNLTLGTEKRISVKREKLQDYSKTKVLGSNKEQAFTYLLTVKNNRKETVQMTLKDQYPKSTRKEIEIELLKDRTPASHNNEDVGTMTWNFELKPGETKTVKMGYTVKYPKNQTLNL